MKTSCVKNGRVMVVILLFIGVAVQPGIAVNPISSDNEEDCNLCAKKVSKLQELGKYQELSDKITTLIEMNKELKPDIPLEYNPVVCAILTIILSPLFLLFELIEIFYNFLIIDLFLISILLLILPIIAFPCLIILEIGIDYGCWDYPSMV